MEDIRFGACEAVGGKLSTESLRDIFLTGVLVLSLTIGLATASRRYR